VTSTPSHAAPPLNDRCIRLRRPPVLNVMEGVFVPDAPPARLREVERRWQERCAANPAFYDGRLYHVLGVHRNGHGGATLHVIDCAYRHHAVQDDRFDIGVRPLGVKGITIRDGHVLMGRRSQHVNAYRGLWEFAPGGVVEPGDAPAVAIVKELREETSLRAAGEPTAVALLHDGGLRTWELIHRITAADGPSQPRISEYTELRWCEPSALPGDLSPLARQMMLLLDSVM
jgi:8-oxo-dGTP diphosphatase